MNPDHHLSRVCNMELVHPDDVARAIDRGANVNYTDSNNTTAIHWVCRSDREGSRFAYICVAESIAVLLDAGCDINKRDSKQRTALAAMIDDNPFFSVSFRVDDAKFMVVQELIRGGAQLDFTKCDPFCVELFENAMLSQGEYAVSFLKSYGYTFKQSTMPFALVKHEPLPLHCLAGNIVRQNMIPNAIVGISRLNEYSHLKEYINKRSLQPCPYGGYYLKERLEFGA